MVCSQVQYLAPQLLHPVLVFHSTLHLHCTATESPQDQYFLPPPLVMTTPIPLSLHLHLMVCLDHMTHPPSHLMCPQVLLFFVVYLETANFPYLVPHHCHHGLTVSYHPLMPHPPHHLPLIQALLLPHCGPPPH
jgi:hypothetical protein